MNQKLTSRPKIRADTLIILFACASFITSVPASSKDNPSQPRVPDVTGKWEGLASDDGQLGTAGLSVFTFQLSQNGVSVSGPVTVRKAAFANTYGSTIAANLAIEHSIWVLRGSFDFQIDTCQVHVTFNAVENYGSLVGNHAGTNSCRGKITGGSFVLDKK